MTAPAYAHYRKSRIEWLGNVPTHWADTRVRFVARLNPSKSEVSGRARDEEVSFIPMDAIGEDGSLRLDQTRARGDVENGYTYVRNGDVAVAKITPCFENGKGAIMRDLVGGVGFGTTELIVARPLADNSPDFVHWLFNSTAFRKLGEGAMYGAGGQKRVPDDFVRDFPVALPPPGEQAAIAAFLDRETGKIDALVEAQTRLIELLKEKRQAVISHAVTKGLDPAAPMKDSGVEWLGQVPAHWDITRLKYVGEAITGLTYTPDDIVTSEDDGTLVLRSSNVQRGGVSLSDNVYVSRAIPEKLRAREGDILICSRNGSRALIGKNARIDASVAGETWGAFMTVFRTPHSDFLYWVLNSEIFSYQAATFLTSTINQLTIGDLNSFAVPLPPEAERKLIAARLTQESSRLDALVFNSERAVALLQERRAALISAAVTGKIDVRGLAPAQAEAA